MKALTLTQPWATLVAIGAKRIETRSWSTRYRGPLAIHAAKKYPYEARHFTTEHVCYEAIGGNGLGWTPILPLGAVVATCNLIDCVQMRVMNYGLDAQPAGILGPYTEMLNGCHEREFGDYAPGRYAWILRDIKRLSKPIPAKGMLGLWEWDQRPEGWGGAHG